MITVVDRINQAQSITPVSSTAAEKIKRKTPEADTAVRDAVSITSSSHLKNADSPSAVVKKPPQKKASEPESTVGEVVEQKEAIEKSAPRFSAAIMDKSVDPQEQAQRVQRVTGVKPGINPRNARVIEKAFSILRGNRMTIKGHTFTTPSKVVDSEVNYEGKQWLWDSAFHAMVLSQREPEIAKEELRSVFANQHQDGFVPHMNYFRGDAKNLSPDQKMELKKFLDTPEGADIPASQRKEFAGTFWSYDDHSDITQPPILATAVEEIYNATGDKEFVKEMLPKLKGYYNYLHDKRDPDGDNLISIIHQWESGWDHSQRWDEVIGASKDDRSHINHKKMRIFALNKKVNWDLDKIFEGDWFNVEPVDFNVLYSKNMESLSRLCKSVGDREGEKLYKQRAEATAKAVLEKMWDGDKYVDLYGKDEKKSSVKSAAMFYPMMLEGEQHGKHLVERHLLNPKEFNVKHSLPTTSVDHPLFNGGQYWRGNVWTNVNYFVWKGLQNLLKKHPDYMPAKIMADKIKDSSFELLDKSGFSEYFDPKSGEGHGAKSFGWNGIVRFMESDYK